MFIFHKSTTCFAVRNALYAKLADGAIIVHLMMPLSESLRLMALFAATRFLP